MSVIEQAAKRLEELNRAGVEVPWRTPGAGGGAHGTAATNPVPGPGRLDQLDTGSAAKRGGPGVGGAGEHAKRSTTVQLDLDHLGERGFLVPALVRSNLANEFRDIKRPLLKIARDKTAAVGKRGNVIMVSSALEGEGKTFCAINLAMSIAMEVDSSVLLVDADVQRPAVLAQLGLQPVPGLIDVLKDPSVDLPSVMLKTNVPKLTLLPAGSKNANSNELLASAAMERLLDELATRYADRIVIVDTPPLLLTTESRVLASKVGQIVVVVEAFRTGHGSVAQAFAAVEQCPNVFAILNKCAESSEPGAYGYYDYN